MNTLKRYEEQPFTYNKIAITVMTPVLCGGYVNADIRFLFGTVSTGPMGYNETKEFSTELRRVADYIDSVCYDGVNHSTFNGLNEH